MRSDINALLLILVTIDPDKLAGIARQISARNTAHKPARTGKNSLDCVGRGEPHFIMPGPAIEIGADGFGFHAIAIANQNQRRKITYQCHWPCS